MKHANEHFKDTPALGVVRLIGASLMINAPHLVAYLNENLIPLSVANRYLLEVDCQKDDRIFKALGCPNPSGNYEVIGPEGIGRTGLLTYALWGTYSKKIGLFNNQLDFLREQKFNLTTSGDHPNDSLIATDMHQLGKALPELEKYEKVHCYFDHTLQGRALAKRLSAAIGDKMVDFSKLFEKDLSYHRYKVKAARNIEKFLESKKAGNQVKKL
ncbi:hypothetical protein [Chitinophaga sancti]|uniref:Uncharacterized protein n=1 Tax=Chitinophaga sancti TaxID=1004 RepID=A0A1K1SSY3_9BACT|nr:hypothetical protein [Chitinophaga sancti]WQD65394.1 hypothetical protein U0033_13415 [Chitinophaga sancti]WQG88982.1 hypothetical protein SR876_29055 [Chitinophaga sancti]SFW87410.1 hypothetical protein SAMN05661012_06078 [Chitinophaga sancti]